MEKDAFFQESEINRRSMLTESQDPLAQVAAEEKAADEKKYSGNLEEDVIVKLHSVNDHYTHYVEKVANPAEMFELTKFGKTMGYIQAPTIPTTTTNDAMETEAY